MQWKGVMPAAKDGESRDCSWVVSAKARLLLAAFENRDRSLQQASKEQLRSKAATEAHTILE